MQDEEAEHAHHLLHGHVRVIEEGAVLVEGEFIDEPAAGRDRILRDPRPPIHLNRDLKAVPVHGGRLGQAILNDDTHPISLVHFDRGSGHATVVAPDVADLAWQELPFHHLGHEVENLDAVFYAPGELGDVRCLDREEGCAVGPTREWGGLSPSLTCGLLPLVLVLGALGARDVTGTKQCRRCEGPAEKVSPTPIHILHTPLLNLCSMRDAYAPRTSTLRLHDTGCA